MRRFGSHTVQSSEGFLDILEEAVKLHFAAKNGGKSSEKTSARPGDGGPFFAPTNDREGDDAADVEETQDVELEDTQSEVVSLPPSSRPPSPRSVADTQSEPVDFDMDEEEEEE